MRGSFVEEVAALASPPDGGERATRALRDVPTPDFGAPGQPVKRPRRPRPRGEPRCRRRGLAAIARVRVPVLACLLSACVSPQAEFPCTDSCECMLGAEQGTCEPTGFCSFDSEECKSGRRYGDGASSDLRDACVGGADAIYVAPT